MKLWTRNAAAPEDFADARAALRQMSVPAAGERLLARIAESHRRGLRIALPLEDPAPPRRTGRWVGGLATAAVAAAVAIAVIRPARDPDVRSAAALGGWFAAGSAWAATPGAGPVFPALRVAHPSSLHPLRLEYRRTAGRGKAARQDVAQVTLTRDVVEGVAAWRAVCAIRGGAAAQIDTTWVSAATRAPLRRAVEEAPYLEYQRIVVRQNFEGLRVRGEMQAFRSGALAAQRRFDRTLPANFVPFYGEAFTPFAYAGVELGEKWTGSIAMLGWAVRDNDVFFPIAMRVDGDEVVTVPAGTFPCWRVLLDVGKQRQWYWVRKTDGLGVRAVNATAEGTRTIELIAERAP